MLIHAYWTLLIVAQGVTRVPWLRERAQRTREFSEQLLEFPEFPPLPEGLGLSAQIPILSGNASSCPLLTVGGVTVD